MRIPYVHSIVSGVLSASLSSCVFIFSAAWFKPELFLCLHRQYRHLLNAQEIAAACFWLLSVVGIAACLFCFGNRFIGWYYLSCFLVAILWAFCGKLPVQRAAAGKQLLHGLLWTVGGMCIGLLLALAVVSAGFAAFAAFFQAFGIEALNRLLSILVLVVVIVIFGLPMLQQKKRRKGIAKTNEHDGPDPNEPTRFGN